jgi:hypothetical protein
VLGVVQRGVWLVSGATLGMALGMALGTSHTAGSLAFSSDGRKLVGRVNGYAWPMPNDPFSSYGVIKVCAD